MSKQKLYLVGALVVGIIIGAMFAPSQGLLGGSFEFTQKLFPQGFKAGLSNQFVIDSSGNLTTSGSLTSTGALTLSGDLTSTDSASVGKFTQGGGISTISTTSATYTLTQAELEAGNVISIANTASALALTLSTPASSSFTTLIPNAGDSREWMIQNLHSDAATTTTIAGNTGVEMQVLSGSSGDVAGAGWGKMSCYRQASTNVVCYADAYTAD